MGAPVVESWGNLDRWNLRENEIRVPGARRDADSSVS